VGARVVFFVSEARLSSLFYQLKVLARWFLSCVWGDAQKVCLYLLRVFPRFRAPFALAFDAPAAGAVRALSRHHRLRVALRVAPIRVHLTT